eukprot:1890445-Pleurochrysis_carterae.AAC.5
MGTGGVGRRRGPDAGRAGDSTAAPHAERAVARGPGRARAGLAPAQRAAPLAGAPLVDAPAPRVSLKGTALLLAAAAGDASSAGAVEAALLAAAAQEEGLANTAAAADAALGAAAVEAGR